MQAGAVLRWGRGGTCAPDSPVTPQIQKLADHSDLISEVAKMLQNTNFPGLRWGSSQFPRPPSWWGGAHCPLPRTPSQGPRFYGSQGPSHYRVGNPTNDRFPM